VYDNGGETSDRYTVVFTGHYRHLTAGETLILGMSGAPFWPQGICMHSTYRQGQLVEGMEPGHWPPALGRKGNLGTRIRFEDLPRDCQIATWQDYADLWGLEMPQEYRHRRPAG
jgi:hypothetical protein